MCVNELVTESDRGSEKGGGVTVEGCATRSSLVFLSEVNKYGGVWGRELLVITVNDSLVLP